MAGSQRFSHTQYPTIALVEQIDSGELSLPDLQRPFVWKQTKVRDLFDSLYRGYPAGYFLFWATPTTEQTHQFASSTGQSQAVKVVVDGQQRLTSLYCVLKGKPILDENNEEKYLRIAFNPLTCEFESRTALHERDPEWIDDISNVFTASGGSYEATNSFLEQLKGTREVSNDLSSLIGQNISKLESLKNFQFSALELPVDLGVDEVAEIFVRINSAGINLNSADFILTLMSVHRREAREKIEEFCRLAKIPSLTASASPFNHFLKPSPGQILRVAVGLGLKRGRLETAYNVLRGQNPETQEITEEYRDQTFEDLLEALSKVMDLNNWHDFFIIAKQAGYRSGKMVRSHTNFLGCYLAFLIGRHEFNVGASKLREVIARWIFMVFLTGRYTENSSETMITADLRRFQEIKSADGFVELLDQIIHTQLTGDFWEVTLVDRLETTATNSRYNLAYHASLNLLDAKPLFSKLKFHEILDPGVQGQRNEIEQHHLFPKGYLSTLGISGTKRTNQIANYSFVEWRDNAEIGKLSPDEYFPKYFETFTETEKKDYLFWHALPENWTSMEYYDFIEERRRLIRDVIKQGFLVLEQGYNPYENRTEDNLLNVSELLHHMETNTVEFKSSARASLENDAPEKVINEGIVKTVAAFLNSNGGTLAIGITDDGDICGIQPDLELKHQDIDQYENWLTSLLMNSVGQASISLNTSIRFEPIDAHTVCLIDVEPSKKAVYAKTTKGNNVFYVRVNNSTRILEGPDLEDYLRSNW